MVKDRKRKKRNKKKRNRNPEYGRYTNSGFVKNVFTTDNVV